MRRRGQGIIRWRGMEGVILGFMSVRVFICCSSELGVLLRLGSYFWFSEEIFSISR